MNRAFSRLLSIVLCWALAVPPLSLTAAAARAEAAPVAGAAADEFDLLRQKWYDVLTGGNAADSNDPDIAAQIRMIEDRVQNGQNGAWDTLQTGADRTSCDCLWTDLTGVTKSGNNVVAYDRLRSMALAYVTPGSRLRGSDALRAAIVDALDWMYANRYNENTVRYDNWYHWEMSGPENLMDTVVLMYPYLTAEQIGNYMRAIKSFAPDPNLANGSPGTGANRVEKAWVYMLRGVLARDGADIALARDALSDRTGTSTSTGGVNNVFAYTTVPEADGMHTDGSFLQHGPHPYIGNYGTTFFQLIANAVYLLNGSSWEIKDPLVSNVSKWVYDSFAPTLYKGGQMDMFRGRLISNSGVQSHVAGHRVIQGVLTAALFAPAADAEAFKRMVKSWVTEDTYRSFLQNAPIFYSALAKQIVSDSAIAPYGEMVLSKNYTQSDRIVHRRPGFAFGIAMSSTRVYRYESINGNNLHGWRMGDGMTYLYNGDLGQYDGDYWATVDMYRLPGITTAVQTLDDKAGQSTKTPYSWVGGASDGEFGAVGMQFNPYGTDLTGKKSWFLFDNEIVALGAGITSSKGQPVQTIVENRRLNDAGSSVLTVNGEAQPVSMTGGAQTYADARWMHLAGSGANSDIGYYFPAGSTVYGLREARTGSWGAIQGPAETEPITRNYQELWFDHGTNPSGASYQYAVLPGLSPIETAQYAADPGFVVLENSPDVQAVKEKRLGIVGANFWNDTPATVRVDGANWLSSNAKASVLTKQTADRVEISVADPTQLRSQPIELELFQSAKAVLSADPRITVKQLSPTVRLSVDPGGAEGRTFRAAFSLIAGDDGAAPGTPANLSAEPVSYSEIRLSWSPSAAPAGGVAGYNVFRNGELAATVFSPGYTDAGLAAETEYEYTVQAFGPSGLLSGMSAPARAVTLQADLYVIRDNFEDAAAGAAPSGYTVDASGGSAEVAELPGAPNKALKLSDSSAAKAVVATKPLGAQKAMFLAEFSIMLPAASDYHSWNVQGDGGVNAVTVMTSKGNLIFKNAAGGDTVLQPYSPNTWYTIKILADPGTDTCNIYVNGTVRASGVPFRNAVSALTAFAVSTSVSGTGTVYVDDIAAYPFIAVLDDSFDTEKPGAAPGGYTIDTAGGTAAVADAAAVSGKSVKFEQTAERKAVSAYKRFLPQKGVVGAEFDIMLPEAKDGRVWSLQDGSGRSAVAVRTSGGRLVAVGASGEDAVLQRYEANRWYRIKVMLEFPKQRYSVYIDGVLRASGLALAAPVSEVSRFAVSSGAEQTGAFYMDGVRVYPFEFLLDDDYNGEATGGNPSGYVLDTGGGTMKIDEVPGAVGKSLKFADNSTKAAVATKGFFPQTGQTIAEFDVMLPAYSAYHSWNLKDKAGTNGVTVMTSYINGTNVFIYKNAAGGDTVIGPYDPNVWYRFKIIADPAAGRFSLYMNGELKVIDAAFRYAVTQLAAFASSTSTGGTGTFYLDNVRVYPADLLETQDPVITVEGEHVRNLPLHEPFTAPAYKAASAYYGDLTRDVAVSGSVYTDAAGQYTLRYNVTDPKGRKAREVTVTVNVYEPDTTPPVTTAAAVPSAPDGLNGWYVHPFRVQLSAADDASGVQQSVYCLDGGATWRLYETPIRLEQDAVYTLQFRSVDLAGNQEVTKAVYLKLDTAAPVIEVNVPGAGTPVSDAGDWLPQVTVADRLSGVDDRRTVITLDGRRLQPGAVIPLYTLEPGRHEVAVTARDMAGNAGSVTSAFVTEVSVESLKELVARFAGDKSIDRAGIAGSLQKKLEHRELESFLSEVQAQSGKHISRESAGYLIRDARRLLDRGK
ncbi:polysaccharide lyase family 8 super-sandwich domain-containing protein [Paenibacillus hamazuiensis]|uniref:polysaccharide lyase family 8 super-sandwich domain-containing protein n=1 Tax=Paenibacillus hamazuiensis TaxID=2936508 RepID=UPI002010301C|nr:polysaccharide lyase family 8 super-sandwich domain-containing protein [Paenibacillus hamazuiensis]